MMTIFLKKWRMAWGFIFVCFFASCAGGIEFVANDNNAVVVEELNAPSKASILTDIADINAEGLVFAATWNDVVLPSCTDQDGNEPIFAVTYDLSGLPTWLSFDAATRTVSVNDVNALSTASNLENPIPATLTCTATDDSSVSTSVDFTLNDLDDGSIVDEMENRFASLTLVHESFGSVNVRSEQTLIPTASYSLSTGFNVLLATDDTDDFDQDGVANNVEIENGSNAFLALSTLPFTSSATALNAGTNALASADFNGDGNTDLLVGNHTDETITLLTFDGNSFTANAPFAVGEEVTDIEVADLDNDGDLDAVANNINLSTLDILLNDGSGNFSGTNVCSLDGVPGTCDLGCIGPCFISYGSPIAIALADMNEDGTADILVSNNASDTTNVLLGAGDGTFAATTPISHGFFGPGAGDVIIADFNQDQHLDLATLSPDGNDVVICIGAGDGTFTTSTIESIVDAQSITAADFDSDGDMDFAVTGGASQTLAVYINDGTGAFTQTDSVLSSNGGKTRSADMDGDGDVDLIVAFELTDEVVILENDGSGTFTEESHAVGDAPKSLSLADFNQNTQFDIITANETSGDVTLLQR